MKEQENSPEELDEIKTNNLSNKVFRVMTIRILNNWKKRHRTHKRGGVRYKVYDI